MASSNTPKPHKSPKAKNGEISTTQFKTKKKNNKEDNQKKKNKKPNLSNGNSKQPHEKGAEGSGEDGKTNVFPMNRIRTMIKGEDPDMRVSQEAVLAINKAVVIFLFLSFFFFLFCLCFYACLIFYWFRLFLQEKFLEQFTQDAYASCVQDRKKCLSYKHVGKVLWLRYVSSMKVWNCVL